MVAKVEDYFLAKDQGVISSPKLPWKWHVGSNQVVHGVRDGELLNSSSSHCASRGAELPAWTSSCLGYMKGLQNAAGIKGKSEAPVSDAGMESDRNDSILTSLVSSYLMAQNQGVATVTPGRAEVFTSAPGNPPSESVKTGSCSTPSLCVESPATVHPSLPSDPGSNVSSAALLNKEQRAAGHCPASGEPQLSDHSFSTEGLSYCGSMEDRDSIVNCVDDFWIPQDMMAASLLTDFRFDPMLDDTADTGACGNAFSVDGLDCLVSSNHENAARDSGYQSGIRSNYRNSSVVSATASLTNASPAPDFCHSFLVGGEDMDISPNNNASNGKPSQLVIPPKVVGSAAFNTSEQQGRLRWSDHSWLASSHAGGGPITQCAKQVDKSPGRISGSMPSSPTTPLDAHLFASSLQCSDYTGSSGRSALMAEEIQKKLPEFSGSNNKRSFSAMQMSSQSSTTADLTLSSSLQISGGSALPSRIQMLQAGTNTDKFDAAALSALLYSTTQRTPEFRFHISKDSPTSLPASKQRRRHGTATDPQSIAARTRREKFTDRIRILQSLVPNGERLDTVHMLSQTFEYVRFLQHKVWDLYNGKDSIAQVRCEKWKEFVEPTTGQVIL